MINGEIYRYGMYIDTILLLVVQELKKMYLILTLKCRMFNLISNI